MKLAITATPAAPRPAPLLLYGDLAGAFRQAAEAGCQGLEIHFRDAAEVDLALVKRLAEDYGLGIPTLGTGMAAADGLSFSHPDPHVRARAVDRVRGHVAFAAEVGAAVTIGSLSGNLRGADLRGAALAALARVCRAAEDCGVTVLLEPLNRYECDYINTLEDGIAIIRELGAPNLKLLADSFHMNIEEADMTASLRAAAPFLGHVHLADSNRQAPGHGHLDIHAILRALDAAGYSGYLSFEVFPIPDARQAIRDGISTVMRQS
ncbi:MAG: TIM barrel protein [Bryobacteraceae bacterium]